METKEVAKRGAGRSSLFDGGWMEKMFNAPLDEFFNLGKVINMPAVNVSETDKEYRLSIAAPGLEKQDFNVEIMDDMITISAEKEKEKEEQGRYNRREYNYKSWTRSFTLPEGADTSKIDARYENGELRIAIPKREMKEAKKIKNISVN